MHWTARSAVALALLVVLAGCNGFVGSKPATESTPPSTAGPSTAAYEELENATLWIDGTVERIENRTVYIDDQRYSEVVVPVRVQGSGGFYCHATNDSGLDCAPIQLDEVDLEQEVCANVHASNGSLSVVKIFFNATCGGPRAPPE